MREQWARNIAISTGVVIVLLAGLFAKLQNPPAPSNGAVGEVINDQQSSIILSEDNSDQQALINAGRVAFEANNCMGCHSITGEGNPRFPLDGISKRRTAETIRQWILASPELKDQLPFGVFQLKQAYRHLPSEDIDALVVYLQNI